MGSDPFFHWYVGAWGAACAVALAMVLSNPKAYSFTAPWSTGALYLALRGKSGLRQAYVAACLWMFSASWSYYLYLLVRDGEYPTTWMPNIPASSVLYFSAGLLWNLDWRPGRGVTFSFQENDWPRVAPGAGFGRIFWIALPFMVIAAASVLYFILP